MITKSESSAAPVWCTSRQCEIEGQEVHQESGKDHSCIPNMDIGCGICVLGIIS